MVQTITPYMYEFKANTKARWLGRSLLDVLSSEFKRRSQRYFELAILSGSVKINGQCVSPRHTLNQGDLITHLTHRHEPPIPSGPIETVYEDEEIVVVNKPSGVPCHPNSSYNKNSVTEMVKEQKTLAFVSPVNRLDKQTSGVVMLAKTPEAAVKYHKKITEGVVGKWYLARVKGAFPEGVVSVVLPLAVSRENCITTIHKEHGKFQGRKSATFFKALSRDENGTTVLCRPVSGRTHQIRVHLQALGCSIADDMVYGTGYGVDLFSAPNPETPNPETPNPKTPNPSTDQLVEITEEVFDRHSRESGVSLTKEHALSLLSTDDCRTDVFVDDDNLLEEIAQRIPSTEQFVMETCIHCQHQKELDVLPRFSSLYLHALQYEVEEKTFVTDFPHWATIENASLKAGLKMINQRIQ
ncbi:tRNA pseudouridine synthase 9 [Nematocida displodere]|uniref:Pseudouridine synthase n=1 Tax=Nematocida displodere TaxID=1805483 RepID=A0A177EJB7_9MICR|nr:tRNA pseudouridine synthase 9 [Nematocida displodere]